MKFCKRCGALFIDTAYARNKLFCTKKCTTRWHDAHRDPPRGVVSTRPCQQCGTSFTTSYSVRIYCSKKCGDKAKNKRRGNNSNQKALDFVYQDKIAKGCSRCSEKRPSCLQYHHTNPALKTAGIGTMCQGYKLDRVIEEMQKCIILCANCHFVEELGDGYRPGDRPNV